MYSERKEFDVFLQLLKLVPSLEERLMSSSEDEVVAIAELVSQIVATCMSVTDHVLNIVRFRRVLTGPGRTIQRA